MLYMKNSNDSNKNIFTILGIDLIIVFTTTDISFDLLLSRVTRNNLIKRAIVEYPPSRGIRDSTIIEKFCHTSFEPDGNHAEFFFF